MAPSVRAPALEEASAPPAFAVVDPLTQAGWDAMVAAHSQGSIFLSSAWTGVLADTYGFKPRYFALIQQGKLRGLFPLMEVRDMLGRRSGVCLPFTDECAPILPEGNTGETFLGSVLDFARSRGWRRLEWRGGGALFGAGQPSVRYYTHSIDLGHDMAAALSHFSPAAQRAVRKAEAAGVEVRVSDSLEAVGRYYALHCLTRRRHGLPPQPYAFFGHIHRRIIAPGLGFVAEALHRGIPVASAVFFTFGRKAIYKFGASDRDRQELRANNLVFEKAIERLIHLGVEGLSLGRTSLDNEGLRRFKNGLGAAETTLECFQLNPAKLEYLPGRDEATGWHNEIFRRMPLWLSRLAGSLIYRYAA
jgi:hypothetical protein